MAGCILASESSKRFPGRRPACAASLISCQIAPKGVARKSNYPNRFNLIWAVQWSFQIYFALYRPQIRCITALSRLGNRGVSRSSRTRGGMWWTRQCRRAGCSQGDFRERATARKMDGAEAYGKTVWSRHPWLVPSCRWLTRSNRIDQPSSRQRWRQKEFVSRESTA
jgi:hypothetical protein